MSSRAIPVLAAASFTQFAAGVGFWSFGLLAPELAGVTGYNARDFGLSISFTFLGAFLSSPFTGMFVRRFGGPGAVARFCAAMAGAMSLVLLGSWTGAMLAAFLFGLGYGPQGPVGMTMVTQASETHRRGLFLALRHSAVPLAATLAGRILPPLMLIAGWQAGVMSVAGLLVCAAGVALVFERFFRIESAPAQAGSFFGHFRDLFRIPAELRFLWGTGFAFAFTQTAVTTFSYIYLIEVAGLSTIAAGVFASNLHATALVGRPLLGITTDRLGNPGIVLAVIAMVSVVALIALLNVDSTTPGWLLIPLAIACGISGQCWNSVFVTAMSFKVASADLAEMNGRAFAYLSVGWMASPPVIWALIELSGGYVVPLVLMAVLNAIIAALLMLAR
ncbi:MAG: MFS transporter [Pseudomonadota bacterium]